MPSVNESVSHDAPVHSVVTHRHCTQLTTVTVGACVNNVSDYAESDQALKPPSWNDVESYNDVCRHAVSTVPLPYTTPRDTARVSSGFEQKLISILF